MTDQLDDQTRTARLKVADLSMDEVLAKMAGPQAVAHDDQRQAVRSLVVDGSRVLVVQQTGWGKSAVYFGATKALRSLGSGVSLIVSPLLALMRDQVSAAERAGLRAATLNSTNIDDWATIEADVRDGAIDLLLVSPERLANAGFAQRMTTVLGGAGLIVIDEAHCISDWGFDFRPDYQRLSRMLFSTSAPVLATTATANARVTADVAAQLGSNTVVLRGPLARASLVLSVVPGLDALERYAWVDEALSSLSGSGIIYVPTVAETERLEGFLASQGHVVAAYSGQTDTDVRASIEDALRANAVKAVVATSALGMGYDKPDLGFTIHVGSPSSPVAYYQQVGRAGRAIDQAQAILLPAETDQRLWEYFATSSIPDPENIAKVTEALHDAGALSVASIVTSTGIRKGRVEALLKILAVDDAVVRDGSEWTLGQNPYVYDADKWAQVVAARRSEAQLMSRYAQGDGCLMAFLQEALDDPTVTSCGSCSVCTGTLPSPGTTVATSHLEAAKKYARGADYLIEPRKLWPTGNTSGLKGRITGAENGRALHFADLPGWADLASVLSSSAPVLTDEMLDGLVQVLVRWKSSWSARPVAICVMASQRRNVQLLLDQAASHLGTVGKLEVLHPLEITRERIDPDLAPARKVDALWDAISVVARVPSGPVLLLDDTYRSGWTMTVAAAKLRAAGAAAVQPLIIHQLP